MKLPLILMALLVIGSRQEMVCGLSADTTFVQTQLSGLQRERDRYHALQNQKAWPMLDLTDVVRLRHRLLLMGDVQSGATQQRVFAPALEAGLRRFQRRHGLAVTGILDEETLVALNTPVAARLGQIEASLARVSALRYVPDRSFVLVNLAEQRLYVFEGPRLAMRMRVIIGRPEHPTPILDSTIERVILSPDWIMPRGIAFDQALASARADPDYLDEHNIEIIKGAGGRDVEVNPRTIDWPNVSSATFRFNLRQHPGRSNPLGRVLFTFSNKYNIHIHDTPLKHLFNEQDRRKSLGCVRIEKAVDLAAWLLKDHAQWARSRLLQAIAEGSPRTIWLKEPVDLHIVDWPAWIDNQGRLQFRDEPYRGGLEPAVAHDRGE